MQRCSWILLIALWCASHSVVARAQQAQPTATTRWYGAPILIGGELSAVALGGEAIVALQGDRVPAALWVPTLGAYLLTGPIVHLANDEPASAAASLGVNLLLPTLGTIVGFSTLMLAPDCDNGLPHASGPPCSRVPFWTFVALGFMGAPLLDGLVIARTSVHPRGQPVDPNAWHPTFIPLVAPSGKDGLMLGVGGWY